MEKHEYSTGAIKELGGKGRLDLIPASSILRLGRHFENVLKKYPQDNWKKGIPMHNFIDSALRHLLKYLNGDMDEDHLVATAWNVLCAMWTEDNKPEMQDIPSRVEPKVETKAQDLILRDTRDFCSKIISWGKCTFDE